MYSILTKDLISEIIQHMTISDIYRFKQINKLVWSSINLETLIINEINRRLYIIFGQNWDKIKKELERIGGVISGSFIIQSILGEEWQTDIDIFLFEKRLKYIKGPTRKIADFDDFLYHTLDHKSVNYDGNHWYEDGREKIISVRNYQLKNNLTIQTVIIESDYNTLDQFVYRYADFDICRNVYGIKNGKEYIKICNLNQIVERTTEFKLGMKLSCTLRRYDKYKTRGFIFINDLKDLFDQIILKSDLLQVFYVRNLPNNRYQLLRGDKNILSQMKHYQLISEDLPATTNNLIASDLFPLTDDIFEIKNVIYLKCDDRLICPVKFCYGHDKSHFHIEGDDVTGDCVHANLIFILC